jgi:hypothetical protein
MIPYLLPAIGNSGEEYFTTNFDIVFLSPLVDFILIHNNVLKSLFLLTFVIFDISDALQIN